MGGKRGQEMEERDFQSAFLPLTSTLYLSVILLFSCSSPLSSPSPPDECDVCLPGLGSFLLHQKMERLFWLLSPLAPEVSAPVSCTQISYSENCCSWRTSLQVFLPIPGSDRTSSPALFARLNHVITYFVWEATRNRLVAVFSSDPNFKKCWAEIMIK